MTIANTFPVYTTIPHFQFDLLGLFLSILGLAALIIAIRLMINSEIAGIVLLIFVGFCGLASYARFTYAHAAKEIEHYEYIIQLDEQASAKEFNEKYEILERIGDGIYRVVERTNDG